MNKTLSLAVIAVLAAAGSSHAALVTDKLTAVITSASTADTKGYFGPAGGNLAGKNVLLFLQYSTQAFGPPQKCGSNCFYNVSSGRAAQSSVVITAEIDGHRVVYTPANQGSVYFNRGIHFFIASDVSGGSGLRLPGSQMLIDYSSKVTFGSQLSPGNNPIANSTNDNILLFDASSQAAVETLYFTNVNRVQ